MAVPPVATLPGGRLVVDFTNRKNAPFLFSTRIGTTPRATVYTTGIEQSPASATGLVVPVMGETFS
jgi:hypothetical protein